MANVVDSKIEKWRFDQMKSAPDFHLWDNSDREGYIHHIFCFN